MPTDKEIDYDYDWHADITSPASGKDWRSYLTKLLKLSTKPWLRTPEAAEYSGLAESHLYALTPKEIKSFVLKRDPHALRGIRLWHRGSIDEYLNRKYEEALGLGNPAGYVSWAKEKGR